MPARKKSVPAYCLHKPSGKAYCRIHGKVVYLGDYDSPESKEKYGKVIAEYGANPSAPVESAQPGGITVVEVIAVYMEHAERYYRKNGKPSHTCPGCGSPCGFSANCTVARRPAALARWDFEQSKMFWSNAVRRGSMSISTVTT